MDIRFETPVESQDGVAVGKVREVVVAPVSRAVTHLIIQQGLLFNHDRVVSVDNVASADPEKVVLSETAEALEEETRAFEQESFATVPGTEEELPQRIWTQPPGAHPSIVPPGFRPGDLPPDPAIPMEDIALLEGSPVECANGTPVGTVHRLFTDEENRITHIVIRCTGVYDEYKLLPLEWIRSFDDNVVTVGVEQGVVQQLPDF